LTKYTDKKLIAVYISRINGLNNTSGEIAKKSAQS